MFWVDKIKYEHLAILSNLKSCQFAHRIVIFNLCICCQFEDLQIISPKIIPMSHRNIYCDKWGLILFCRNFFSFLHNSEFLENLIKNYCIRPHFDVVWCSNKNPPSQVYYPFQRLLLIQETKFKNIHEAYEFNQTLSLFTSNCIYRQIKQCINT